MKFLELLRLGLVIFNIIAEKTKYSGDDKLARELIAAIDNVKLIAERIEAEGVTKDLVDSLVIEPINPRE